MSEKKVAPQLPKWRNVGYAEFSKSKKSVRIWISEKFKAEYCYIGVQALRNLLDGRKKKVSIYILGESNEQK
ncbi:hypothetical protein J7K27_08200 [Candidatus Bathyarchaeota archaeon]|nr:hypothetical protein [Candidatus Bathyarchaeota archaeon]